MSTADVFLQTKHRNEQLRQNLYFLARDGNEDNTEIKLLKEVFDIPKSTVTGTKAPASSKMSGSVNPGPATSVSRRRFGTPLKDNKQYSAPPPSSSAFKKNVHEDFDRLTSLRRSVNEIKNSRYELPSKKEKEKGYGVNEIKKEDNVGRDYRKLEGYGDRDYGKPEDNGDRAKINYGSSTTASKSSSNLLLAKLESKNQEIEKLNERINNLLLENQKLSNKSYDNEDEKLTLIKQHEQELEKRSQVWHQKLSLEISKNRKLSETIMLQKSENEELRRSLARANEKREAITVGLKDRVLHLKEEYNKVISKVEDLQDENRLLAMQLLHQHGPPIQGDSMQSNNGSSGELGEVEESTTEIINGSFHGATSNESPRSGCGADHDSTTEFLIKAKVV